MNIFAVDGALTAGCTYSEGVLKLAFQLIIAV
jgi:hypothetical protein